MTITSRGRSRRYWSIAPALIALVGIALIASACGGGGASPGVASVNSTTSTTTASAGSSGGANTNSTGNEAIAFAQCVRAHGVPSFPDPNGKGGFDLSGLGSADLQAMDKATNGPCERLIPPDFVGHASPPTRQELQYAQCIRKHGFPSYPDPAANGTMLPPADAGVDMNSPQFKAADKTCR